MKAEVVDDLLSIGFKTHLFVSIVNCHSFSILSILIFLLILLSSFYVVW